MIMFHWFKGLTQGQKERVYNIVGIISLGIVALTVGWLIVSHVPIVSTPLIDAGARPLATPTLKVEEKETTHFFCIIAHRGNEIRTMQCHPKGE